jgi:carbon storage regulator
MLVLGRREGEAILIEGGIRIVVVSCDKHGVRLGIEAPSTVRILRGELAEQVASENQRATVLADSDWLAVLGAGASATTTGNGAAPVSGLGTVASAPEGSAP